MAANFVKSADTLDIARGTLLALARVAAEDGSLVTLDRLTREQYANLARELAQVREYEAVEAPELVTC